MEELVTRYIKIFLDYIFSNFIILQLGVAFYLSDTLRITIVDGRPRSLLFERRRFDGSVKDTELSLSEVRGIADARQEIGRALEERREIKTPMAIGCLSREITVTLFKGVYYPGVQRCEWGLDIHEFNFRPQ